MIELTWFDVFFTFARILITCSCACVCPLDCPMKTVQMYWINTNDQRRMVWPFTSVLFMDVVITFYVYDFVYLSIRQLNLVKNYAAESYKLWLLIEFEWTGMKIGIFSKQITIFHFYMSAKPTKSQDTNISQHTGNCFGKYLALFFALSCSTQIPNSI